MAKSLELLFLTETGRTAKVLVESPKEPVDVLLVKQSMDQIIAANAFHTAYGNLFSVQGARVVERNVTPYEVM